VRQIEEAYAGTKDISDCVKTPSLSLSYHL
jgi:hypothetical protein